MGDSRTTMSDPDLQVEIQVQDVTTWLAADHDSWATATRFHATDIRLLGFPASTWKKGPVNNARGLYHYSQKRNAACAFTSRPAR